MLTARVSKALRAVLVPLGVCASSPAAAADGRWQIVTETAACEISFVEEFVDDGIFAIDRFGDCGALISRITGYALNNEGNTILFYATFAGVEILGRVDRQEGFVFTGAFRSGEALRVAHLSGSTDKPDPIGDALSDEGPAPETAPAPGPEAAPELPAPAAIDTVPSGPCLGYIGQTDGCAEIGDVGPPASGEMQVLTRMNLRDFPGTTNSNVIGRVEQGNCVAVRDCAEDTLGRLWCGVDTPVGSGFLLKQDEEVVYSRNRCD